MSTNPWNSPYRVSFPSATPAAPLAEPHAACANRAPKRHAHPLRRQRLRASRPLQPAKHGHGEHLSDTKPPSTRVNNPDR